MNVLVTGGAGFIGQYVCEELIRQGQHPVVLARKVLPGVDTRLGDVRDYTVVSEAMAHVDSWIHLAGVLGTQETISDPWPAIDTNLKGAYNMLEAAAKYGLPGVNIAVGNWWMNNPYSITKNLCERLCLMYQAERGVKVSVVRALNAYGPRQSIAAPYGSSKVRKITPAFVCRALTGTPIQVYGDGLQVMDMAHVADVAKVLVNTLVQTMEAPSESVLDAGTGLDTTVLDVADEVRYQVLELTGRECPEVVHAPMRPGEPPHSRVIADPSTLNWLKEPVEFRSLRDGMSETVRWYAENWLPGWTTS